MVRELALSLRPAGWPALAPGVRGRVRMLASLAVTAQIVFVAGWVVAGALEPGYSVARMYVSELGRRGAAHPWIFDLSVIAWGLGFVALGIAMWPGLRHRPWGWTAPALFVFAGVLAVLEAPLRLDCATSVSHACRLAQTAGALSWRHYGHQWASIVLVAALVLTPLALARAEWPSRLGRLTLGGGVAGAALWALSLAGHGGSAGLWQRVGLFVVHGWVFACAGALLVEASPGWPPGRDAAVDGALA